MRQERSLLPHRLPLPVLAERRKGCLPSSQSRTDDATGRNRSGARAMGAVSLIENKSQFSLAGDCQIFNTAAGPWSVLLAAPGCPGFPPCRFPHCNMVRGVRGPHGLIILSTPPIGVGGSAPSKASRPRLVEVFWPRGAAAASSSLLLPSFLSSHSRTRFQTGIYSAVIISASPRSFINHFSFHC